MNDRVYNTTFKLMAFYILASFVLQIWWPELFHINIQNINIITLFYNNTFLQFYNLVVSNINMFITQYLILSINLRQKRLNKNHIFVIISIMIITNILEIFSVYLHPLILIMILITIPQITNKFNLPTLIFSFGIVIMHAIFQLTSIRIRGLNINIVNTNELFRIVLMIDCYVWLILLKIHVLGKGGEWLWEKIVGLFMQKKSTNKKNLLRNMNTKFTTKLTRLETTVNLKFQSMLSNLTSFISKSLHLHRSYKTSKENIVNQAKFDLVYAEYTNAFKIFMSNIGQLILALITMFVFGFIYNKPLEVLFFAIAHMILRPKFNKEYHCNTTKNCILVTTFVIFIGTQNTISINISLLSSILVALIICYIGFIFQDRLDLILEISSLVAKKELTEETLEEAFRKHKVKAKYRHYLKAVLLNKQRDVEYFNEFLDYDDDPQQFRNFKSNFKKKISELL